MRARRLNGGAWLAIALLAASPAFAEEPAVPLPAGRTDMAAHVTEASQRFGVPEQWIYSVMRTESAGRVGAVSSAGAMGLMQLMPGTWARQRSRYGLGSDPFDPRDNILAGTSYLRELYDSYGAAGFLAAYNAGPGRYEDWRDRGRPLPAETRAYVAKIVPGLQSASTVAVNASAAPTQVHRKSWTKGQLFAERPDSTPGASGSFAAAAPSAATHSSPVAFDGLFAPVSGSNR